MQFMQRAETLLDSIVPALFATDQPTRCYILLGASTAKPREAYEIVLPAATPGQVPRHTFPSLALRLPRFCLTLGDVQCSHALSNLQTSQSTQPRKWVLHLRFTSESSDVRMAPAAAAWSSGRRA